MAVTQLDIDTTINKAQQQMAIWANEAADKENQGEDADSLHGKMNALHISIVALQSDTGTYTNDNKDDILSFMNCIAPLNTLSVISFNFATTTIQIINFTGGSWLSLSDTDNNYTGKKGRVPVVNDAETDLELTKLGFGVNILIVSKGGDNSRAERGNTVLHYTTIDAAQTDAVSGDTIIVFPGSYSVPNGVLLGKNGITYNFLRGAIVSLTNATTGTAMFEIAGAATYSIVGDGKFVNTVASKSLVLCATSNVIRARGTFRNDIAFHGMVKSGGTLTLEDCIISLNDAAQFAVSSTTAQSVTVYDVVSNATAKDVDITYLVNNVLLDTNVT